MSAPSGPADVEDERALQVGHLYNLEAIRGADLARPGRRLTAGMQRIALERGLTIFIEFADPQLKWNIRQLEIC